MKEFQPYKILNIRLEEDYPTGTVLQNALLVFWWKKVPLGHLWLREEPEGKAAKSLFWGAIKKAVTHHNRVNGVLDSEELADLENIDLREARPVFERLFKEDKKAPTVEKILLSVVICTRNRPEAIRVCLDSLQKSSDKDFELIVVDNAPDDDRTQQVIAGYPEVKYIREPRKGLDIARNTGARNASHALIAYTDDDVVIHEDWVSTVKTAFDDPMTMAVTGLILPVAVRTESQYIFEKYWGFNRGYVPLTFDHRYFLSHQAFGAPVWDVGAGANMAFRREVFDLAGWFDERLDVGAAGCSGDSEFWYRILAEGWNCRYDPQVFVHHQHRETHKDLHHQIFSYMRGNVCSLLIQHEKYGHEGNLKRLYKALPEYYLKKFFKLIRHPNDPANQTLWSEIKGCFSGWRYYQKHKNIAHPAPLRLDPSLKDKAKVSPGALVSVVIPCYNQGKFLREAIQSVRAQSYPHLEIIVVDDGSTDETAEVCKNEKDLTYVYAHRVGVSAARNIGAAHAQGDFVIFLDADDYLYANAVELHLYYFNYAPESVFVAGSFDRVDANNKLLEFVKPLEMPGDLYLSLLQGNFIGIQSNVMYRKDVFFSFHFNTQLRPCEDYDLHLNITRHLPGFCYPEKIAAYRIHESNVSHQKTLMLETALQVLESQKKHNLNAEQLKALETGKDNWKKYYSEADNMLPERTPQSPPQIAPLDPDTERPLWSVMIPAYNCSPYLEETILSVLEQDQGPEAMQIEVIDDGSTDADVAAIVSRVGKGRVGYFRQNRNVGSLRNFETCINRAKGHRLHILHGDDKILPGFYDEISVLFEQHPDAGAAFTDYYYMNEESRRMWAENPITDTPGILKDWLLTIARGQRIQPPAIVVKRSVYEHLGSFFGVHYGEDWEMWIRIAAHYPFAHSPKHLAHYRCHTQNITSRSLLSGQNIRDIMQVIDTAQQYLPEEHRKEIRKTARMQFAEYFSQKAHEIYHDYKSPEAARVQVYGALRMHTNKDTLRNFTKVMIKSLIRYKQGK